MKRFMHQPLPRAIPAWLCAVLVFQGATELALAQRPPGQGTALAQPSLPPLPPLPPMPGFVTNRPQVVRATRAPSNTVVRPPVPAPVAQPAMVSSNILAFDRETQVVQLKPGEQKAHFVFQMTNVSSSEVLIRALRPSCGCTVAKMPAQPWRLAPGQSGPIQADMTIYLPQGTVTKSLTVDTSAGLKYLVLRAVLPTPASQMPVPLANTPTSAAAERQNNTNTAPIKPSDLLPSSIGSFPVPDSK